MDTLTSHPSAKWRRLASPAGESASNVSSDLAATALPEQMLQGDEVIILLTKPSPLFIFITSFRFIVATVLLAILAVRLATPFYLSSYNLAVCTSLICLARLIWALLVWTSHTYMLTNQRIITIKGVLNVTVVAINLRKVQRTTLYKPFLLRLLNLGTIGIATAATETYDATWLMIARPVETHEQMVAAIAKVQ